MKRDMKNQSFNKEHLAYLVGIASSMFYGTIAHYKKAGLQYADVPEIVGITGACENVDTLFKVGNRLDLPLFFTQTGQLSLEQALQSNHGVYTIIHSGRDEGQEDERHLRQFRLTEEEFDCTFGQMTRDSYDEEKMYELLLKHIEVATKAMISSVLEENKKILTGFYKRDAGALHEIVTRPYLRITYEDAIGLLRQSGHPQLEFGDDLGAQEEQKVVELMNTKTKGYGHTIRSPSIQPSDNAPPRCTHRSLITCAAPSGVRYNTNSCSSAVTRIGLSLTMCENSRGHQKFFSMGCFSCLDCLHNFVAR